MFVQFLLSYSSRNINVLSVNLKQIKIKLTKIYVLVLKESHDTSQILSDPGLHMHIFDIERVPCQTVRDKPTALSNSSLSPMPWVDNVLC